MKKKLSLIISLLSVCSFAGMYTIYDIEGRNLGTADIEKLNAENLKLNAAIVNKTVLLVPKDVKKQPQIVIPKSMKSMDTLKVSLGKGNYWLEVEKNETLSLCIEDTVSVKWVVPSLPSRIENSACLQIQTSSFVGSSRVFVMDYKNGVTDTLNLAISSKYIDLSKQNHKIGFYGKEFGLKNSQGGFNTDVESRVYPDSERIVSMNSILLVDKYPVTNCDFALTMMDSIPSQYLSNNSIANNYMKEWKERKERLSINSFCDVHDSAAIKIYLYNALVYANIRSVREGLEPVYSFMPVQEKNFIPSLRKDGSFDVVSTSFMRKYNGEPNWYLVKVNKSANGYRLPYYNEWMVLARAGDLKNKSLWKDGASEIEAAEYAWFGAGTIIDLERGYYAQDSRPVGVKKANAYGLHDMLGLICENVMLPGKSIFSNEITSCKGGFLYSSMENLNYGTHTLNASSGGVGGYQGLRLVRELK